MGNEIEIIAENAEENTDDLQKQILKEVSDEYYIVGEKKKLIDYLYTHSDTTTDYYNCVESLKEFSKLGIVIEAFGKLIAHINEHQIKMVPTIDSRDKATEFSKLTSAIQSSIEVVNSGLSEPIYLLDINISKLVKTINTEFDNLGMNYILTHSYLVDAGCDLSDNLTDFSNWMSETDLKLQ